MAKNRKSQRTTKMGPTMSFDKWQSEIAARQRETMTAIEGLTILMLSGTDEEIAEAKIGEQMSWIANAIASYGVTDEQFSKVIADTRKKLGFSSIENVEEDKEHLSSKTPHLFPFEKHDSSPETNAMTVKTTRTASAGRATMHNDSNRRVEAAEKAIANG